MSVGINPDLASNWLAATTRNIPFVVPQNCIQLHVGDPGSAGTANPSAVTFRMAASFASPVETSGTMTVSTTGTPPSWNMTAPETISYISVWDALTGGSWLWIARLNLPQVVANGDLFTMGGGVSLAITGLAA